MEASSRMSVGASSDRLTALGAAKKKRGLPGPKGRATLLCFVLLTPCAASEDRRKNRPGGHRRLASYRHPSNHRAITAE